MIKKLGVGILLPGLLVGCFDNSEDDGNPNQKTGVVNMETSRMGMSGGFIDVDADGKVDFITGAPHAKTGSKAGAALIYLDYENNQAQKVDAFLSGEADGDFYGFRYADVGDVNGDSTSDFAISAINAEGEASLSGAVYVYQGGVFPPKLIKKLNGENALDKFGFSIAGADVNGDGENDIIVSAPHTFHEEFQAGAVYVYFGGPSFDAIPDVLITGDEIKAGVGMAVTAGDVNGDDVADIIMDGHAKVFIYYGGADIKTRIEKDPTPNVKIRSDSGAHGGSGFGYALAYAGDVNGDGIGDIAVGNPRRSSPSLYDNSGTLYIFKGGENLPAEYFEDNTDYRIVKVIGTGFNEQLAYSITAVGDVDGGGKPDLIVGARWANSGVDGDNLITGNVFLFHGEDLNVPDPAVDQTVELATMSFSQQNGSAELGSFVAVHDHKLVSGMPGSNKHDGGLFMTELHEGNSVITSNDPRIIPDADPHAKHNH